MNVKVKEEVFKKILTRRKKIYDIKFIIMLKKI